MRLNALDDFKCIADKCPQHCCVEWKIALAKETITDWRQQPKEVQQSLMQFVRIEQTASGTDSFIKKKENGDCICLKGSGLCTIQSKYGEELLPSGCRLFPRMSYQIANVNIETASMACPELTRLISDYDTLELFNNELSHNRTERGQLSSRDSAFTAIYQFTRKILVNCQANLAVKISLITNVTNKLVSYMEQANYNQQHFEVIYKKTLSRPQKQLKDLEYSFSQHKKKINVPEFLLYWEAIITIVQRRNIEFKGLGLDLTDIYNIIHCKINSEKTKVKSLTRLLCYRNRVGNNRVEKILENYIYVIYINHGFPLNPYNNNLFLALSYCNVVFSITSILLAVKIQKNEVLDKDSVNNIIWQVERIVGSSDDIYNYIAANDILFSPNKYSPYLKYLFGSI